MTRKMYRKRSGQSQTNAHWIVDNVIRIMIKSCFFLMNPDRAMQSYGKMKLKMSSFRWYLLSEIAVRVLMVAGFW